MPGLRVLDLPVQAAVVSAADDEARRQAAEQMEAARRQAEEDLRLAQEALEALQQLTAQPS